MKKTNNKGFSLVELIIVIAIMAILIGVLAPQYIKYVERSRRSADMDSLDALKSACTTAAADPAITDGPAASAATMNYNTSWGNEVRATLGCGSGTAPDAFVKGKLKSKVGKANAVTVSCDANGNFKVVCGTSTDKLGD